MIALSVAKLKMFSPESEIFLWIKPKKKKKTFLWKVWINADVYKYPKRQEMFFVMSLRLSDWLIENNISIMDETVQLREQFETFKKGSLEHITKGMICQQFVSNMMQKHK